MSTSRTYSLYVSPSASRTIHTKLSASVAAAVVQFITGSLLDNPHRVGNELRYELAGIHAARRGAFRVLYEIDEEQAMVKIIRIEHRADVYRPR